jgi:replicative DNA helicase
MLHRPKKDSDEAEDKQLTEVHIVKQRNGPVGKFSLRFIGENARFENVTEKLFSNNPDQRQK